MFERWRQENFFKYMRQEYLIDGLVDYQVELDDPQRSVPNPARKQVDSELRKARAALKKVQESYGAAALDRFERGTADIKGLTDEQKKIRRELAQAQRRVDELRSRQKALPRRVPLAQARQDDKPVKLATERKHLTNVLKMVAYQIESDLVQLLRPHYARTDDEGRTLIQTALQSAASLESTATTVKVTLRRLSSPHRSKAIAALCDVLTEFETEFPGTKQRLHFAVAGQPSAADAVPAAPVREVTRPKSGQNSRGVGQEF
jgi:chromosome segregation ATPase